MTMENPQRNEYEIPGQIPVFAKAIICILLWREYLALLTRGSGICVHGCLRVR